MVRVALFNITWRPIATSMVTAMKKRKVSIYAVGDGNKYLGARHPTVDYLIRHFKDATRSHIKWCTDNMSGGCITNAGNMHSKFITLSATRDPSRRLRSNVSWISSANMTIGGGAKLFNNSMTVYGDSALHAKLRTIWSDMWKGTLFRTDYFDALAGRGYAVTGTGQLFASPERTDDLVANLLSGLTVASSRCWVRVVHAQFSNRSRVVDQLRRLRASGCRVAVLVSSISEQMLTRLRSTRTSSTLPCCAIRNIRRARYRDLHDKFILTYDGGTAYRVITGSHNLTGAGNYFNDEVLFRTSVDKAVHDAYYFHFSDAWRLRRAQPCRNTRDCIG